jgi:hypothetical protein
MDPLRRDGRAETPIRSIYEAVDPQRWLDQLAPFWTPLGASIADTVRAAVGAGAIPPTQVRGLGNILALLVHSGIDPTDRAATWMALTPIARAALGARVPAPGRARGHRTQRSPRKTTANARYGQLPLLEQILARQQQAFLVDPRRGGPLPAGRVFVPRALAAGYEIPAGIELAGRHRLEWGEDAFDDAEADLRSAGYQVTRVQRDC